MIKYEGTENKYLYDKQILKNIVRMLETGTYFWEDDCTQENVSILVNEINSFLEGINPVEQEVILERHETEEEAREYFGTDFIKKFDDLVTFLDKQQTIVALHGTDICNCKSICEDGLKYKNASLFATTIQLTMAYGKSDICYDNYEMLLNWPHLQKKGIIILAIPYECYYKEGLWNHYQQTNTDSMGEQDYKIDPDFIVGYLDVENKNIVLNSKYNRQHNYAGYVKDTDIFHENNNMDNTLFAQSVISSQEKINKEKNINIVSGKDYLLRKIEAKEIVSLIEDMRGTFNGIVNFSPNGMNEKAYQAFLMELANNFRLVQEVLPLLKTNEQVRLKKEKEEKRWNEKYKNSGKEEYFDWDQWNNLEFEQNEKTNRGL